MCHRDVTGCGHQLDGILSLLPEDQNITNQDLRTGNIAPFLHLLAALIRWMNPQPAHDVQVNIAPTQDTLTGITLICPVIGYRGVMAFAAWRLTLVSSTRNYLHVQRRFYPESGYE